MWENNTLVGTFQFSPGNMYVLSDLIFQSGDRFKTIYGRLRDAPHYNKGANLVPASYFSTANTTVELEERFGTLSFVVQRLNLLFYDNVNYTIQYGGSRPSQYYLLPHVIAHGYTFYPLYLYDVYIRCGEESITENEIFRNAETVFYREEDKMYCRNQQPFENHGKFAIATMYCPKLAAVNESQLYLRRMYGSGCEGNFVDVWHCGSLIFRMEIAQSFRIYSTYMLLDSAEAGNFSLMYNPSEYHQFCTTQELS